MTCGGKLKHYLRIKKGFVFQITLSVTMVILMFRKRSSLSCLHSKVRDNISVATNRILFSSSLLLDFKIRAKENKKIAIFLFLFVVFFYFSFAANVIFFCDLCE